MGKSKKIDEQLRDGDVFDLFISLLNSEKEKRTELFSKYDEMARILKRIKIKTSKITYHFSLFRDELHYIEFLDVIISELLNNEYKIDNTDPLEVEKPQRGPNYIILLEKLLNKIRHGHLHESDESLVESYSEIKEEFSEKLKIYAIKLVKSIIATGVHHIIELYFDYIESYSFIHSEIFIDGVLTHLKSIENIVDIEFSGESLISIQGKEIEILFNELRYRFLYIINPHNFNYTIESAQNILKEFQANMYDYVSDFNESRIKVESKILPKFIVQPIFDNFEQPFKDRNTAKKNDSIEFDLEIICDSKNESVSELFETFFLITKIIESIKGIGLTLESIEKGSLRGKFKVKPKDIVAKEEFKTVLTHAAEFAGKALFDTSITETEKNRIETRKAILESKNMEREIESALSIKDQKRKNKLALQREKKELDKLDQEIKSKKIDNAFRQLELMEKLSELLAKKIIDVDMIDISLDGISIIKKENGILKIGNIDEAFSE